MENFDVIQDIAQRTGGDIYLGVVGPVRTGKSPSSSDSWNYWSFPIFLISMKEREPRMKCLKAGPEGPS